MLKKRLMFILRTTISDVIVVLLFFIGVVNIFELYGAQKVNSLLETVNMLVINKSNIAVDVNIEEIDDSAKEIVEDSSVRVNPENNRLTKYPSQGEKYGQVKISSIGVDLPLYFGDSLEILKRGIGHSSWSYFPGEGGSIVCMGHNYKTMLRNFSNLKIGAIINVKTTYGEYNYRVYDMKIVGETQMNATPIQDKKEIFMIYTCYPFNNVGYTTQRYMVYAERI